MKDPNLRMQTLGLDTASVQSQYAISFTSLGQTDKYRFKN